MELVLDAPLVKCAKLIFEVTFLSGYTVWNIDNGFCAELRAFRNVVGMPLGFMTELHGWYEDISSSFQNREADIENQTGGMP
jgi:Ceramidase